MYLRSHKVIKTYLKVRLSTSTSMVMQLGHKLGNRKMELASCWTSTHREIFSKSYQIKSKSDCIHHAPVDLEYQTNVHLYLNQSENGKYNLISVWFSKISLHAAQSAILSLTPQLASWVRIQTGKTVTGQFAQKLDLFWGKC